MARISNYNMQWVPIKMQEVGELPATDNLHSQKLDHFGREKEKTSLSRTPNQGIRLVYTLGTTTRSDVLQRVASYCVRGGVGVPAWPLEVRRVNVEMRDSRTSTNEVRS